ncbi:porin family protein [Hymenobacter wooponensis]|uniref:PorT family protein n=1 Tax=Hymenobacter wooponensis TaxID=1525360 RepID=A0A4Z0MQM2_9BACT|nr:porin family protein [Hymenobacter wooponensis]TGD81638.1 PorT family protein [Hymenobacter wooponensis]
MKRIFLLLAALAVVSSAQAQLGLRGGLNTTLLNSKSDGAYGDVSANEYLGYQVGVFYAHKLTEHIALVPEVAYSRQIMQLRVDDYSIADAGYSARVRLSRSYLQVPVMLRATFGKFYLEAGPQAGFLVGAHEKGTEYLGTIAGTTERQIDRSAADRYRRIDLSLCAGLGVQLPAGFGVNLRSSSGLIAFNRGNELAYASRDDLKNQVLQASITYLIKPKS